jgi:hypothetical protein
MQVTHPLGRSARRSSVYRLSPALAACATA